MIKVTKNYNVPTLPTQHMEDYREKHSKDPLELLKNCSNFLHDQRPGGAGLHIL